LIARRLAHVKEPDRVALASNELARARIRSALSRLLSSGWILVVPAAPDAAHPIGLGIDEIEATTGRGLVLSSIASLGGFPELVVPFTRVDGHPVGLGLVGAHGSDEELLAMACELQLPPRSSDDETPSIGKG
jgi:amidase